MSQPAHPMRLVATIAALCVPILAGADVRRGVVTAAALRPCSAERQQPAGSMCGQVLVPEDRGVKGGRQIALSVVVLPARSAGGHADPIFGIAGGPGIGSTRLAVSYPRSTTRSRPITTSSSSTSAVPATRIR